MIFNKERYTKISNDINIASNIAIFCHINPDGDTIGSGLALYKFLKKLNKNVAIFVDDTLKEKLSFLPNYDKINNEKLNSVDLSIAVDVSDEDRLGVRLIKKYYKAKNTICIDHHKTNTNFANNTLYEPASATCEIIYKLLSFIDESLIDTDIAYCLTSGIITDSGGFHFNSTTPETHEIIGKMYDYDFSISDLIYKLIREEKENVFRLKNRVLSKTLFDSDSRIAIITFTKEDFDATGTSSENTEGIITNLINIDSVQFAVSITEDRDKSYRVSFRTKAPYDSADCAMAFGGGGHKFAAGCRINGYYYDVLERVLKVCRDRL